MNTQPTELDVHTIAVRTNYGRTWSLLFCTTVALSTVPAFFEHQIRLNMDPSEYAHLISLLAGMLGLQLLLALAYASLSAGGRPRQVVLGVTVVGTIAVSLIAAIMLTPVWNFIAYKFGEALTAIFS